MLLNFKIGHKIQILAISILVLCLCVVCIVYDGTGLFGEAIFDDPRFKFSP